MSLTSVSQQSFQDAVVEASRARPVLVDFWGPRCGPCLKMMPWVDQVAASAGDTLSIVTVNTAEEKRLSLQQRVMGLPTFALFRDGAEVARLAGDGCTPAAIAALLREHVPAALAAPPDAA